MYETSVSLIGMSNGYEVVTRYLNEVGIIHEDLYAKVVKQKWAEAVATLEEADPFVRFVDYTPCDRPHSLTFGPETTVLRITPMFCQQAAYTVTLLTVEAYDWVRDLLGCGMYHLTATPT